LKHLPGELFDLSERREYPVRFSPLLEQAAGELADAWRRSLERHE
jgi:hypothetical protein